MSAKTRTRVVAALALAAALQGCGGEEPRTDQRGSPRNTAASPATSSPGANAARTDGGAPSLPPPPPRPLDDRFFTESEDTRDPFRNFAARFVPVSVEVPEAQQQIKLRDYELNELHLVAIVLGTSTPYAMVVDPTGQGTIIQRGEYVGRPEVVSSGLGAVDRHPVPWRVTRIVGSAIRHDEETHTLTETPGAVVFEREDRMNPGGPRVEHVLSLDPAASGGAGSGPPAPAQNNPGGLPPLPGLPVLPNVPGATSAVPGQNGTTFVQSYTTVTPPQQAPQPAPTTVTIQTGPQGQTTVNQAGQPPRTYNTGPTVQSAPVPPSNQPPPVTIQSGAPSQPLPMSGLPR